MSLRSVSVSRSTTRSNNQGLDNDPIVGVASPRGAVREERWIEFPGTTVLIRGPRERSHPTEHASFAPSENATNHADRRSSNVRPLIDLEDHSLQPVASSVARREIPHIAMVALQECLPEGNGMQLDLRNYDLFRDHRT